MDKTWIAAVTAGITGVIGGIAMLLNSKFFATKLEGRIKKEQSEIELRFKAFDERSAENRAEIVQLKESLTLALQKIEQLTARTAAAEARNELLEKRVLHLEDENTRLSQELHDATVAKTELTAELRRRGWSS